MLGAVNLERIKNWAHHLFRVQHAFVGRLPQSYPSIDLAIRFGDDGHSVTLPLCECVCP